MSPFILFNSLARRPILRWLLIALMLAGLLLFTSRAWSASSIPGDVSTGVVISVEPAPTATKHTASPPAHKVIVLIPTETRVQPVVAAAPAAAEAPIAINLASLPDSVTITQGEGGAAMLTVTSTGSDAAGPKLTTAGLPNGVTASFTPEDTDGRCTMMLDALKDAAMGPAKVTVTAMSGKSTSSTVLTVNVIGPNDPDFTPTVLPGRVVVPTGSDNSCAISFTPRNGFSGPVTFSMSGLPAGVVAEFEPATTSTASTLHLVAADDAAAAGTPITILATSGGITHTARVLLSVAKVPDFALKSWSNSVSVDAGSLNADTIRIEPLNGFASPVQLSVSGLPNGVSADFSPSVAKTGSSTLVVSTASTAPSSSTPITILAMGGGIVHRWQINLNVAGGNTPSFALNAWPSDLTLYSGGRAANTVSIVRQNGFDGVVDLSVTGLPDGVTGSFSPASTHGSSTLTIAARDGLSIAKPVQVTVTGVSGGISSTTTLTISLASRQASAE